MIDNTLALFKNPPKEHSPLAFWFWSGTLETDKLKWQIDQMVDKGVYGAFMHSRAYIRTPYLEKEWWEAVDACVERSREKGFFPWLYDEYAWPSGTAGSTFEYGFQKPSRILAKGECNMAKGLYVKTYEPAIPICVKELTVNEEGNVLAAYIIEGCDNNENVEFIATDLDSTVSNCKIMVFFRKIYPTAVDYLNKQTIKEFIEVTHEEYFKRYGKDFGTLIPGIFFDEIFMTAFPLPWTDSLPDEFNKRCDYDIISILPLLMLGGGKQGKKARGDYYRVISELYEEAFFKQISDFCNNHGLLLTGHTEENLRDHPRRQGNFFNTMRHLHIPGADNHDYRYRYPRKITYVEPKYSVSVARAYGRSRAMSEALGGAGWCCDLQQYKRGINVMGAMGINMFTLHGFYYECEHLGSQADWPASFFYQNPYWKYFKIFSDYISRICYMNSAGDPVVDIGLFYPIDEIQMNTVGGRANETAAGIDKGFHTALNTLLERQIDVDMVDALCILRSEISDGILSVGKQRFKLLLFPNTLDIKPELGEKLRQFRQSGGHVVFYRSNEADAIPTGFEDCLLCDADELPSEIDKIIDPDIYISEGSRANIFVSHRRIDGNDIYYVANGSSKQKALKLRIKRICTECEYSEIGIMDIETGEVKLQKAAVYPEYAEIPLNLLEDEAFYLLFGYKAGTYVNDVNEKEEIAIPGSWKFLPLDKSFDDIYSIDAKSTVLQIPIAEFSDDLRNGSEKIRIRNTAWEDGNCGRHISMWEANWITLRAAWNCSPSASDLYFRRIINLDDKPQKALLCIAAVNECILYVNGQEAARFESNAKPVTIDVAMYLTGGENLIAAHIHNNTPSDEERFTAVENIPADRLISFLMQGDIMVNSHKVTLVSDKNWIVCDKYIDGWQSLSSDYEATAVKCYATKARTLGRMAPVGTWLYAWERGKPPLQPWRDLPLFGQKLEFPQKISYGVTIPAGTVKIKKPICDGEFSTTLDGKEIIWDGEVTQISNDGRSHFLNINATVNDRSGGLKDSVTVEVEAFDSALCDWRLNGYSWFSGRTLYSNSFRLKKAEGRYVIDLGQVKFYAEIWINGKQAGVKLWNPYIVDITEQLCDGENTIDIIVANTAAVERRHMLVDEGKALGWSRYWNEDNIDRDAENLVSGLLGPVRIYRFEN